MPTVIVNTPANTACARGKMNFLNSIMRRFRLDTRKLKIFIRIMDENCLVWTGNCHTSMFLIADKTQKLLEYGWCLTIQKRR